MKVELAKVNLGDVTVKDGKIIATDPCYQPDGRFVCIVNIKPGNYTGRAVYGDAGYGWGERVWELTMNHESTPKKKATTFIGCCAVDSGQCGFFALDDYKKFHPEKDTEESEKWYRTACDITCNDAEHCVGLMRSLNDEIVGIVSESGIGDGMYNLYAGYNNRGEITALRLRFLE